jgi:hypothetical protein
MAGTLITSTLQGTTLTDGTNSTSTTNCIQGSAKAWVNFVGSSGSINASYNVSSVTRNTTGSYTLNFTNAFSNSNYATVGTVQSPNTGSVSNPLALNISNETPPTTSNVTVRTLYYSSTYYDYSAVNVVVFR